jgi:hypothetical protein
MLDPSSQSPSLRHMPISFVKQNLCSARKHRIEYSPKRFSYLLASSFPSQIKKGCQDSSKSKVYKENCGQTFKNGTFWNKATSAIVTHDSPHKGTLQSPVRTSGSFFLKTASAWPFLFCSSDSGIPLIRLAPHRQHFLLYMTKKICGLQSICQRFMGIY